jgi:hypothetical protein
MYTRISSRVEDITPRKAESLIKLNTFEGQRNLNRRHVDRLVEEINSGRFRRGEIAIATNGDGLEFLMNGQHQLAASIQAGKTICVTVDNFRCENEQDIWHLFGTFDVHKSRTQGEILSAAKPLLEPETLRAIPSRFLMACGSALLQIESGNGKPIFGSMKTMRADKLQKIDLLQRNADEIISISRFAVDEYRKLITTPIVTAMITTRRANPNKFDGFWDRVIIGDQLDKGTPQYQLRKAITVGITSVKKMSGGWMWSQATYCYAICWWNAYVTGQKRTIVKFAVMKSLPEILT